MHKDYLRLEFARLHAVNRRSVDFKNRGYLKVKENSPLLMCEREEVQIQYKADTADLAFIFRVRSCSGFPDQWTSPTP